MVLYGDYFYVFGGDSVNGSLSDVRKYNCSSDSWVNIMVGGSAPAARSYHGAVVYGDYMYIYIWRV